MGKLVNVIRNLRIFGGKIKLTLHAFICVLKMKKRIAKISNKKTIYYLGIPEHSNLGDNAQYLCIKQWIKDNFTEYNLFIFDTTTVCDKYAGWLCVFKKYFDIEKDIIIFQSGYTTHDLGGKHDYMHRLIADEFSEAHILMMPQTIYFKNPINRKRTSDSYDKCHNMLFLARDEISYKDALNMFPHVQVKLFPDIVTTLIGIYSFNNERNNILICRRNDGEKFYSEDEMLNLKNSLSKFAYTEFGDTQYLGKDLTTHLEDAIYDIIKKMSTYKCVITDRYHGTIFSLCANTPVIILKTNDHKVISGASWFKGIYDSNVFVVESLDEAYEKAKTICSGFKYIKLEQHFKREYYDKLRELFLS